MKDFIKEVLEDPSTFGGFKIISYKEHKGRWYGVAQDRINLTKISWSTWGHSCTYFGKKLDKNISVGIRKDADTRYVFNGYCYTKEDFIKVLNLTW
ncbi:MAG: hypothetical protein ACJAVA_000259 [Flavobacteriaceae bacterium]|jgi:hypothetical protein